MIKTSASLVAVSAHKVVQPGGADQIDGTLMPLPTSHLISLDSSSRGMMIL